MMIHDMMTALVVILATALAPVLIVGGTWLAKGGYDSRGWTAAFFVTWAVCLAVGALLPIFIFKP